MYLHIENSEWALKGVLSGIRADVVENIRSGLRKVIDRREIGVYDYEALTDFEFRSEDEMYAYLEKVWSYVFTDSTDRPWLPVHHSGDPN
jgi:hypothetical protein